MSKFKSLLTGGIIGAVAGLLLAPLNGKETRDKIKEEGEKLNQKAKEVSGNVKTEATKLIDKAKEVFGKK